jgi:hypothetical protein
MPTSPYPRSIPFGSQIIQGLVNDPGNLAVVPAGHKQL